MKFAFVGDSFCANIDPDSWPRLVANKFHAEILLSGRPGDCFYHSLSDLFPLINEIDYIIFCVTGADRIANFHRLPLNAGRYGYKWWKETNFERLSEQYEERWNLYIPPMKVKKIMESAYKYYTDLADSGFHHIAQHGMLKLIDDLMIEKKKRCIWFSCFGDSMGFGNEVDDKNVNLVIGGRTDGKLPSHVKYFKHYMPKSGPLGDTALYDISYDELILSGMTDAEVLLTMSNDDRSNHLNKENNEQLANLAIDIIMKDTFAARPIKMQDTFNFPKIADKRLVCAV